MAIKRYPTGRIEYKYYDRTLMRLKDNMEKSQGSYSGYYSHNKVRKEKGTSEHRSDNLHRSFTTLLDYIEYNNNIWKTFITLTFAELVSDLTIANQEFNKYINKVKRVEKNFLYIGVPEFQKNGRVHYHILTNLECDSVLIPRRKVIKTFNKEKKKFYNLEYYDIKYWGLGYSTAFSLKLHADENFNVGAYMGKYFYKDIDKRLFGRRKILKSQNLPKPKIERYLTETKEHERLLAELSNFKVTKTKGIPATNQYAPNIILTNYLDTPQSD